jgi:hypothetical protein
LVCYVVGFSFLLCWGQFSCLISIAKHYPLFFDARTLLNEPIGTSCAVRVVEEDPVSVDISFALKKSAAVFGPYLVIDSSMGMGEPPDDSFAFARFVSVFVVICIHPASAGFVYIVCFAAYIIVTACI